MRFYWRGALTVTYLPDHAVQQSPSASMLPRRNKWKQAVINIPRCRNTYSATAVGT